jgi:DnaJ-class molecular chaperone
MRDYNATQFAASQAAVLGLRFPMTMETLKVAYRASARKSHPDAGGNSEKFRKVQEAYEYLCDLNEFADEDGKVVGPATTRDGRALHDLGRGLGPTKNGRPCDDCRGVGYHTIRDIRAWDRCNCAVDCYRCTGTGRIADKRGGPFGLFGRDCPACFGSGLGVLKNHKRCRGTGKIARGESVSYSACTKCNGCGETEMFNPVFPKMRVG